MSQQQWGAPSRTGGGGGSVRRARERAAAGVPPEMPYPPAPPPPAQNQGRFEQPRQAPSQPQIPPRARPQMPAGFGTKNGQGPIGVAISRPTQIPQWPLAGSIENAQDQYQPPAGLERAPQRPPRPSVVPSILDGSRIQDHTPSFQYNNNNSSSQPPRNPARGPPITFQDESDSDEYEMRSPITPLSQNSRPSTVSSVGTIPDFPVPALPPMVPRRSANLGPPPTSRRGVSTYWSQASFVSPIPEESPRSKASHGSYASSAAIPSSWGSDVESPGYDYDDDKYGDSPRGYGHEIDVIEERGESRGSNFDYNDDRGLIRSASLGKKAKPTMITTKSAERVESRPDPLPQQRSKMGEIGAGALGAGGLTAARMNADGQRGLAWPMVANTDSPLAGGTGWIDESGSSSDRSVPQSLEADGKDSKMPRPPPAAYDAKGASEMLGAYAAASSLEPPGSRIPVVRTPSPGFSRLSAIRRPPRLDIDAVRDAEARGSLTSLPDLIRRATRLAALIDGGKRPASRMALDDFPTEIDLSSRDKEMGFASYDQKRQSGLSGMLAAFPPPGLATPTQGRPLSKWPQFDTDSAVGHNDNDIKNRKRRCCGLPLWGFLLVLLILLMIIAAAVVVPLELLVLNKSNNGANSASSLSACASNAATECQNGGSSTFGNGSCGCICINGFTGSTCTAGGVTGCTTADLSTTHPNVTLGSAIPRLITDAQNNYSIPLDANTLLERFTSGNLSCVLENALVTFDGFSSRMGSANAVVIPSLTPTSSSSPLITNPANKRAISTLNGIAFDPSSSPIPATTYSASVSPTTTITTDTTTTKTPGLSVAPSSSITLSASTTIPTAASETSVTFLVTETILDFARIATLYVLQENELQSAVQAQTNLQQFFTNAGTTATAKGQKLSLGGTISINLVDFSINLGSGSVGALNTTLLRRTEQRTQFL